MGSPRIGSQSSLLSPYKDLTYLNDTYKRAIIESQRQEEISLDVENSLNDSYDIQPLKTPKTKQLLVVGELGKHCKAALVFKILWDNRIYIFAF